MAGLSDTKVVRIPKEAAPGSPYIQRISGEISLFSKAITPNSAAGKSTGDDRNSHDKKHRIQQQTMRRIHNRIKHLADAHHRANIRKQ